MFRCMYILWWCVNVNILLKLQCIDHKTMYIFRAFAQGILCFAVESLLVFSIFASQMKTIIIAFFNHITRWPNPPQPPWSSSQSIILPPPPPPPPSQGPFSLKYKRNIRRKMEFRMDVWHSSNWTSLCESYMSCLLSSNDSIVFLRMLNIVL
jgi:hypothetical protein